MKKKIFILVMSICIVLLAGGCGSKGVAGNTNSPTPTATSGTNTGNAQTVTKGDYVVDDYIKLGQYKGIKVTVTKLEVTDDAVNAAIQDDLKAKATQKDIIGRPVQNGDTVNIDYEGLKDGVAFSGGTAKGSDLTIGSGTFIPGIEEGLIGHNIGEKVALNITFPADYSTTDLAGKAVVFNVTINSIKESVLPELTEDYVKNNSDYASIDAYKEGTRAKLQVQNEETMKNQKTNDVFTAIAGNSKISSLPQTLLDYYKNDLKNYYTQYAQANGMDFASFLGASSMTQADFDSQAQQYAESMATQELVIKAIIEAEKMTLTDDEYNAGVDKIVSDYGYPSKDDLLKSIDESQIRENLLMQKAMDFVTAQAVEG